MKRAIRRHHRQRLLRKRADYWGGWTRKFPNRARILINTPTPCSCMGCSANWERRNCGHVTLKERAAEISEMEQRNE